MLISGGDEIAIRFVPESAVWLESLSLRTIFLNEIVSTGLSQNEPRNVIISLTTDVNGMPGTPIVENFLHQFQRSFGNLKQETIVFHDYHQGEIELREPFFVVVSNDNIDSNYFGIGMDSMMTVSETYTNFTQNNSQETNWQAMETASISGSTMSGWNAMCRVSVVSPTSYVEDNSLSPVFSHDHATLNLELSLPFSIDTLASGIVSILPSGAFIEAHPVYHQGTLAVSMPLEVGDVYTTHVHLVKDDQEFAIDTLLTWALPLAGSFELIQNFPNPFNRSTTLPYIILKPGDVKVQVFDILGREQRTISVEHAQPGAHKVELNLSGYPSGVYFCRVEYRSNNTRNIEHDVVKLLLIK